MKFLMHALVLPALLVSTLGCVKLVQDDTIYAGSISITGDIRDNNTNFLISDASVTAYFADETREATVSNGRFTVPGIPIDASFRLDIRASGYLPFNYFDGGYAEDFADVGDIYLTAATRTHPVITVEVIEGHGDAFQEGTVVFAHQSGGGFEFGQRRFELDGTTTFDIPANTLYTGDYLVYVEDGVDRNGIKMAHQVYFNGSSTITIRPDLTHVALTLNGMNSGDYPTAAAADYVLLESASFVTVNTDGTCTATNAAITPAAGQSATWTWTFKEPMLLNYDWYFDNVTDQTPGWNFGLGAPCSTLYVDAATTLIAVTPPEIFTTGATSLTVTISGMDGTTATGNTCGDLINLNAGGDLQLYRASAAGTELSLNTDFFLSGGVYDGNYCNGALDDINVTVS